jgi:hypothetical protein
VGTLLKEKAFNGPTGFIFFGQEMVDMKPIGVILFKKRNQMVLY